ncbi:MAG: GNAT family N-acetyltransferase [Fibrobacterales bacterium]
MSTITDVYSIEERLPTLQEFTTLSDLVAFDTPQSTQLQKALDHTIYGCCLTFEDHVIGFGRVVGDSALYYYIQDVIIHPDHQHRGCGREILNHLLSYLAESTDSGAFIGLFSGHDMDALMAKYQFVRDSFQHISQGMFFVKR